MDEQPPAPKRVRKKPVPPPEPAPIDEEAFLTRLRAFFEDDSEAEGSELLQATRAAFNASRPKGTTQTVATVVFSIITFTLGAIVGHGYVAPEVITQTHEVRVVRPACVAALDSAEALVTASTDTVTVTTKALDAMVSGDDAGVQDAATKLKNIVAQYAALQNTYVHTSGACRQGALATEGG